MSMCCTSSGATMTSRAPPSTSARELRERARPWRHFQSFKKRRVVEGLPRVVFKTREWFPFAVMTIQFSDESSRCSVLCQSLLLPHCPWNPVKSLTIPSNPCVYFKRKRLCQYRTRQVQIYNVDSTFFPRACILFMYLHTIYAQHWRLWIIIITLVCECDKIRFTVSCAIIVCDQFACSLDWTIIFNVQ